MIEFKTRSQILTDYLLSKIDYNLLIEGDPYRNNHLKQDILQIIENENVIEIIENVFYDVFPNNTTKYQREHKYDNEGYIPTFIIEKAFNKEYVSLYSYNFDKCSVNTKNISKKEYLEYKEKLRLQKLDSL